MKITNKAFLGIMVILLSGALLCAGEPAAKEECSLHFGKASDSKGFYLALPAYLYAQNSTFGVQLGYQANHAHIRLDANFAEDYRNDEDVWFFMPTVGLFYTKDYRSIVRFYEGLTFGMERGMVHSFDGTIYFLNYITGAELISFGDKTFFIEVGSGASFRPMEGTYFGGTVIGGGFKCYLN